jgi:V8-like Glu-specific endopeptidase
MKISKIEKVLLTLCLLVLGIEVLNLIRIKKITAQQLESGSIIRLVKNGRTFCSGTIVDDHTIITAAHCVTQEQVFGPPSFSSSPIEIRENDNVPTQIMAVPYYGTPQLDQALLDGDFHKFKHRKYTTNITAITKYRNSNTKLTTCGYPMGGDLYCGELKYDDLNLFMWQVEGLLLPGMSGGPVMTPDGTVIAVNVAVEGNHSLISPIYNLDVGMEK